MLFSKKWLKNHPKFLLHFLIHIDVLMLCRKFELIPTLIFRVMAILKKLANFWKKAKTIVHGLWRIFIKTKFCVFIHFLMHVHVPINLS